MKKIFLLMVMAAFCLTSQAQSELNTPKDITEMIESGVITLPKQVGDIGILEKVEKDGKTVVVNFTLLKYSEYISFIQENPQQVKDFLWENLPLLKEKVNVYLQGFNQIPDFGLKLLISNSEKTTTATVEFSVEEIQEFFKKLKE